MPEVGVWGLGLFLEFIPSLVEQILMVAMVFHSPSQGPGAKFQGTSEDLGRPGIAKTGDRRKERDFWLILIPKSFTC